MWLRFQAEVGVGRRLRQLGERVRCSVLHLQVVKNRESELPDISGYANILNCDLAMRLVTVVHLDALFR